MSNKLKLQLTPVIGTGWNKYIKLHYVFWQVGDFEHIKAILKD